MKVYDRFSDTLIDVEKLPEQIDLGRFVNPNTNEDLTNRTINVGSEKIIRQEILENDSKSLQSLFCQFYQLVTKANANSFEVKPIFQSIKGKLFLNKFESLLEKKLFHLEEIFRQPHYLLQRTIEKVNVSRAKRIPAKSYQNLASHTEDWLHKSIVNFKPHRILNEELDLLYDVYENQVTVALIERCLLYLNSRIKEIHDITEFLKDYSRILSARDDSRGWYQKIDRNLKLFGDVYEDQNYCQNVDRSNVLAQTQAKLLAMQRRLKALQSAPIYNEVNKRVAQSLMRECDVRPTNVIANHKHYRYVRELWIELNTEDMEQSEEEKNNYEQTVIEGVRCYSKALIVYIIKDILKYDIEGRYSSWRATSNYYSSISMEEKNGVIYLTIGNNTIRFVTVANDIKANAKIIDNNKLYILSLGSNRKEDKIINVSPYDADSVERVGSVIMEYILRKYIDSIKETFNYPQSLKDYVRYINCEYVLFSSDYTYTFLGIPQTDISEEDVIKKLEVDGQFNRRSRIDKDKIRLSMRNLISDINVNGQLIFSRIRCHNRECHLSTRKQDAKKLEYLQCECGFVLDSKNNHISFKNKDHRYKSLSPSDWGMDFVDFPL